MIELTVETEIARPVREVFAYVTDEQDGPLGIGTRLREVHRVPGGKQLASLVEVSEYDPDRTFALHMIEGALPIDARLIFEPTGLGTRLTFAAHGQPPGPLRLAQPFLRLTLKRQFTGYCATLKQLLENAQPAS